MSDDTIADIANDTELHLRALTLVNRLGELPVDARGPVLDAWEDALEATLHPVVLVASPRDDDEVVKWIQMVGKAGGIGRQVTSASDVMEALHHDHARAILLDADHMDSTLRMIIQIRAREKGAPIILVTAPHKLWALGGTNGHVHRVSPALEDIRYTLTEVLEKNDFPDRSN